MDARDYLLKVVEICSEFGKHDDCYADGGSLDALQCPLYNLYCGMPGDNVEEIRQAVEAVERYVSRAEEV